MKNGTPTVFVIDDDDAVRSSLRLLFKSYGLEAVLHASADEFLASYDLTRPGCVVLDVRMPGMSGLELQQRLNAQGATIPIVFITGHGDVPMAVEAMQAGAFDFLQKPFRDDDLLARVQKALARDAELRALLRTRHDTRARLATLTPRERDVLDLVVVGKANKVIAADLGLSQRTVEIHRARVMEKMDAASLAQLVRMVLDLERSAG
ncbi:MAG: Transcriptional regulatory protein FixJ [Steroidobacteraceae bacterium]|nr:Transcriptional regulatory protein FixJ [Steroidobacteraceae bacterium]